MILFFSLGETWTESALRIKFSKESAPAPSTNESFDSRDPFSSLIVGGTCTNDTPDTRVAEASCGRAYDNVLERVLGADNLSLNSVENESERRLLRLLESANSV